MHGLGLFDVNAIRNEYIATISEDKRKEAAFVINQGNTLPCQVIPHRTMLDVIRNIQNQN